MQYFKRKSTCPGDGVVVFLDAVVGLLQTRGLKWRLSHQQSVPEEMQTEGSLNSCTESC